MHPMVEKFIKTFEEESDKEGRYRKSLGKYERIFLEEVWGPEFQYDFDGLRAEYPLKDFKGGDRFVDFVFIKREMRLLIEIDGFTTHAREISPGDFDDHLMRQNDTILAGWMILRFSAHQVEKRPMICRRQIMQAMGHWWSLSHADHLQREKDIWFARKRWMIELALRQEGMVRAHEVAKEFAISPRTALNWLTRLTKQDVFTPVKAKQRITGFHLSGYGEKNNSSIY